MRAASMTKMDAITWPTMIRRLEYTCYISCGPDEFRSQAHRHPSAPCELIIQPKPPTTRQETDVCRVLGLRGNDGDQDEAGTTSSRSTTHAASGPPRRNILRSLQPWQRYRRDHLNAKHQSARLLRYAASAPADLWPALVPSQCLVPGGCSNALESS